jgi:hypothetical protein
MPITYPLEKDTVDLLYFKKFGVFPNFQTLLNLPSVNKFLDLKQLTEDLTQRGFHVNSIDFVKYSPLNFEHPDESRSQLLILSLTPNFDVDLPPVYIELRNGLCTQILVRWASSNLTETADLFSEWINQLNSAFVEIFNCKITKTHFIYLITAAGNSWHLTPFELSNKFEYSDMIEFNYNDGFKATSDLIIDKLSNDDKGLILLHGGFGTGKTMYARYLCQLQSLKKKIIYLYKIMAVII